MAADAGETWNFQTMDLDSLYRVEEFLEEQVKDLEDRIRLQLEEKAFAWVEDECRKRLEKLRSALRREIQEEVESWIEEELRRRMEEFSRRNRTI